MKKVYGLRIKAIYICIIVLFISVILTVNFAFRRSRNLLITQEAGIISQYMNRNQLALVEVTNSIRKLSAASSTNKEVAAYLNQPYQGNLYSAENIDRIRSVESTLTFYRNIFFDYRLHYIILGADETIYSVVDGIDNSSYFGSNFSSQVTKQDWYLNFITGDETSQWISPCIYNIKGEFNDQISSRTDESFLLFVRRIRDYNTQRFLGVSFVSFPADNLSQVLVPYDGASMALLNEYGQMIYVSAPDLTAPETVISGLREQMTGDSGYFYHSDGQTEYLVNYITIAGPEWVLVNLVPLAQMTKAVDELYDMVSVLMFVIVSAAGVVCLAMYFYINAPLGRIFKRVSQVHIDGTKISDLEPVRQPAFGIVEVEKEIGQMVDTIEQLSEQTMKQHEIEQNLRFEMLRAQLTPHFLFNTLNVIKWSAMISGADNIADMITSLGLLLENSMNRKESQVTLQEELKMVEAWVEIKNWALKNRIELHTDIPEEVLEFKVIKFCLQPLVENSVLHGMEHSQDGRIWIKARRSEGKLYISIEDNGTGMDQQTMEKLMQEMDSVSKMRHVTGIGIKSIHELMKIKYGPEYGIRIESEPGKGTKVLLVFPFGEGEEHVKSDDC